LNSALFWRVSLLIKSARANTLSCLAKIEESSPLSESILVLSQAIFFFLAFIVCASIGRKVFKVIV
jgi:hypothetical protein